MQYLFLHFLVDELCNSSLQAHYKLRQKIYYNPTRNIYEKNDVVKGLGAQNCQLQKLQLHENSSECSKTEYCVKIRHYLRHENKVNENKVSSVIFVNKSIR